MKEVSRHNNNQKESQPMCNRSKNWDSMVVVIRLSNCKQNRNSLPLKL